MLDTLNLPSQMPLRDPAQVMRLRRLGAAFPTRLSFLRVLLRMLASEQAQVTRPVWQMSPDGYGHAVYAISFGGHTYSLVAVSTDLPQAMRTDRVIATAWDTAFVLYDGVPEPAEIARIVRDAPLQEAARFTHRDLVLSRANKSVRLWDHVVACLQAGQHPDAALLDQTGYLMRTTAVYGNGKFGIADRAAIADRPGLAGPFMAEMLTVWLIRGFTHDLVEHVGGAPLPDHLKRHLGIGNATGLGMAPFLVTHPLLLDAWMQVRETALARVRAVEAVTSDQWQQLTTLMSRAAGYLSGWTVVDPVAAARLALLRTEWSKMIALVADKPENARYPMDHIIRCSERFSVECQELTAALVLEPFGALVDGLASCLATPFEPQIDPLMTCAKLMETIRIDWDWACEIDFAAPDACAQFWYVSEEKLEPRLGDRHKESGADQETPLDIARQVQALARDLTPGSMPVAAFLRTHPQHRAAVRRVQTLARHPYAEIRDNLIDQACLPIDMLRCKLAFFGAGRFDPKSDRWTRITLAQGAPLFDDLATPEADDWWLAHSAQ